MAVVAALGKGHASPSAHHSRMGIMRSRPCVYVCAVLSDECRGARAAAAAGARGQCAAAGADAEDSWPRGRRLAAACRRRLGAVPSPGAARHCDGKQITRGVLVTTDGYDPLWPRSVHPEPGPELAPCGYQAACRLPCQKLRPGVPGSASSSPRLFERTQLLPYHHLHRANHLHRSIARWGKRGSLIWRTCRTQQE